MQVRMPTHDRDQHLSSAAHRRGGPRRRDLRRGRRRSRGDGAGVHRGRHVEPRRRHRLRAGFGGNTLVNIAFISHRRAAGLGGLGPADVRDRRAPDARARRPRVDVGELLRTIGFASTPGLLRVLGIMPARDDARCSSSPRSGCLLAMVVAVRQALDYRSTGARDRRLRARLDSRDRVRRRARSGSGLRRSPDIPVAIRQLDGRR